MLQHYFITISSTKRGVPALSVQWTDTYSLLTLPVHLAHAGDHLWMGGNRLQQLIFTVMPYYMLILLACGTVAVFFHPNSGSGYKSHFTYLVLISIWHLTCNQCQSKSNQHQHRLYRCNLPMIPKRAFFTLITGTAVIQPSASPNW